MRVRFPPGVHNNMRYEFSAGGVVFKKADFGKIEILVARHSQHHGWVFPKGLIGDKQEGESKENTAIREVKEETGVDARIIHPLTPVTYWFAFKGEKIKKTVYYYIMEALGGDITQHDSEMEEVGWIVPHEVTDRLTYSSDKKVWQEAKTYLDKTGL